MAWTLGMVKGISVRIHWSLLIVLPFFAYIMALRYFPLEDGAGGVTVVSLAWGAALAVTLFLSVLLHEFSHSLTAMRRGIRVESILLFPLGGVSQMERMPTRPRDEFVVTVVGPLTNFVLAAPLLALGYSGLLPTSPAGIEQFVRWAGWLNVAIGAFNLLLPAFPLDGGRLLRAALATKLSLRKATHIAAGVGRGTALVLGLLGIVSFQAGGFWLILIALFIYMGAQAEERATIMHGLLEGAAVRDLMTRDPVTVRPDDPLSHVHETMLRTRHTALPVVSDGRLAGYVGLEELGESHDQDFGATTVAQVMRRGPPSIGPGRPASDVLQLLQKNGHGHVLVLEQDRLVGIVSRTDVERVVRLLDAVGADSLR